MERRAGILDPGAAVDWDYVYSAKLIDKTRQFPMLLSNPFDATWLSWSLAY